MQTGMLRLQAALGFTKMAQLERDQEQSHLDTGLPGLLEPEGRSL